MRFLVMNQFLIITLITFATFYTECHCNLENVDLSSVLSNVDGNQYSQYSKVKSPDDVRQVREWKEKCREEKGEDVIKEIEEAPNKMVKCVLEYIKVKKLQVEIDKSIKRGSLDKVFKKYCGYRVNIMGCIDTMLGSFSKCLTEQQLVDVNVTRKAIDAGIDFTCHDDGDRIALFMAEQGQECVKQHKDGIKACVESRVPDLNATIENPDTLELNDIIINEESCGKLLAIHDCIIQETSQCEDPTPANILDSLLTQMIKVTPCHNFREVVRSSASHNTDTFVRRTIASIGPILCSTFAQLGSICLAFGWLLGWFIQMIGGCISLVHSSIWKHCGSSLSWIGECCSWSRMLVVVLAGVSAANLLL